MKIIKFSKICNNNLKKATNLLKLNKKTGYKNLIICNQVFKNNLKLLMINSKVI